MATIDPTALRGRPVVVTGAGGFLGSAVVRRLVEAGAEVRALVSPAGPGWLRPPAGLRGAVHGDIEDRALLGRLVEGADCVYHLAGSPSVAESFVEPARTLRAHAAGTAVLLEQCLAAGVRRIVYVSSAEVYAPPDGGRVSETHPRAPRSPYGIAKLAAELLLETCAAPAMQATILRPFSIYGPGASPRSLLGRLLAGLQRGEALRVADLRPVRDYCFVADAADAIVCSALREGPPVRAYNIASGRGVSVAELAGALLRAAGRAELAVTAQGGDRPASALTLELLGDPSRAREELGFSAATPLELGLAVTWRAANAAESAAD